MSRELVASKSSRPLRYLTIVSTLTGGGTERAAVNYALGYKQQGSPSAVLAYNGAGHRKGALDAGVVEVFVGGRDMATLDRAVQLARAWEPDVLHIHRPGIPDETSAAILRSLIRPSLRVFETNVFGYVDDSPARELIDVHLQLSRWCMWKWRQGAKGLKPASFAVVVPYAVDARAFFPVENESRLALREAAGIPQNAIVFGRIGQPDYIKWSPWLIDSFAQVAAEHPEAWLAVVGLPAELQLMARRLPAAVQRRILQLPMVESDEQLRRCYALMDIFVHASRKGESFGMVLCESMLCGVPVITASSPLRDNSQIEVVRNETTGLVVDSRAGLTDAMNRLARDSDLRGKLARAGPAWVQDNFSIDRVAPRLIRLAELALAADSIRDLREAISESGEYRTSIGGDTSRAIRQESGLPSMPVIDALAATINSHASRTAIHSVRSMTRRFRRG